MWCNNCGGGEVEVKCCYEILVNIDYGITGFGVWVGCGLLNYLVLAVIVWLRRGIFIIKKY